MKYNGKLYGKLDKNFYFDTGKTSDDWDELLKACKDALRYHQGGHSEIGHLLRKVIKKAES